MQEFAEYQLLFRKIYFPSSSFRADEFWCPFPSLRDLRLNTAFMQEAALYSDLQQVRSYLANLNWKSVMSFYFEDLKECTSDEILTMRGLELRTAVISQQSFVRRHLFVHDS